MIFPLVKQARKSPDALGQELGEELIAATDYIDRTGRERIPEFVSEK